MRRWRWLRERGRLAVEAVLHQERVVHRRDDCEEESRAKESNACDLDPANGLDQEQHDEEDG